MKTTATVTRMLYKHTKRLQIKRTPKKKARVNELMKTIAMTRMPYKRTRRLINIKRSTKKKTQRTNEPTGFSSQSTAVLEDKSSLSGSDEVQDTAENEEESTSPSSSSSMLSAPTRGEVMREIFAVYANVPDETVLAFHRSITEYVFDFYGSKAFLVEDGRKPSS
ncbi:unnamed protein product [Nippostrongylus brasiliensis]|uniref:Uncharacterized protein n=1 Tax=Nippostrongylus brasiliensis TaxID=27835 RepID=A0A0N4YQD2_NIPBR|nr:unnamed protein product [Nippostrongylus brasiliensis]